MKRWPRVHVVLVNYGGWGDTIECLESLLRLDYPDFRVIVCDNASPDGSLDRLKAWADGLAPADPPASERLRHLSSPAVRKPVPYVEYDRATAEGGARGDSATGVPLVFVRTGENLGFAGGNNIALRYLMARAEPGYVWLLNNDTVVPPDALRELVAVAERDETIGVVGGCLLHYSRPDVLQAAGGGKVRRWHGVGRLLTDTESAAGAAGVADRLDYVTGACMLVPLRMLATVGLMDERYFAYSEEADWCFRMRAHGLRLAYAPAAKVWHKEGRTLGRRNPLQDYLIERNGLLLVRRFFTPFVPVAIAYSIVRCFLPKLLRGEWKRLGAIARAYRDFVRVA